MLCHKHLSQNIEEWIYVMSLHVSQNHLTIFSVKLAGEQNLLKGSKKWLKNNGYDSKKCFVHSSNKQ